MLKKAYFSIIITDQKARTFHKITLSNITLGIISFVILCTIVAFGFMLHTYLTVNVMVRELAVLEKENASIKEEVKLFQDSYDRIADRIDSIKDMDKKLYSLTAVEGDNKDATPFGVGGPNPEDSSTLKELERRHDDLAASVSNDLDRLLAESKHQEESFNELMSFLQEQEDVMNSTPAVWPVKGFLTSRFGPRWGRLHAGIDIANKVGTIILAPADGVVLFVGIKQGYGNFMTISHGYGITTNYGHLSSALVKPGDKVKRGDRIALIGNTGNTTGPHLHYEVLLNGMHVDPLYYILN